MYSLDEYVKHWENKKLEQKKMIPYACRFPNLCDVLQLIFKDPTKISQKCVILLRF